MDFKTRPLRIAVFHNLPSGGALRTLYEKVRLFERNGHRVSLFTFSTSEKGFLPLPRCSGIFFEAPLDFSGPFKFARYFKASRQCADKINASDADVVWVDKCRFFGAPPLLQFVRKPALFYAHEPLGIREYQILACEKEASFSRLSGEYLKLSSGSKVKKILSLPGRWLIKKEDRKSIRSAKVVMTCSRFVKDWIKRVYGLEAVVHYQGVDVDFFCPAEGESRQNQVLSVGRIEPRKAFDFLLEVLGRMPEASRPALVIVSDEIRQEERQKLEGQALALNVKLEVRYRPGQEELRDLYRKSRAVLCAGICEPFGLSPLEAMACGTPVVAVPEGGYPETVSHDRTGLLLARDAGLWAAKLGDLLNDPEKIKALGTAGRCDAEKRWNWNNFLDGLEFGTEEAPQKESAHGSTGI